MMLLVSRTFDNAAPLGVVEVDGLAGRHARAGPAAVAQTPLRVLIDAGHEIDAAHGVDEVGRFVEADRVLRAGRASVGPFHWHLNAHVAWREVPIRTRV